MQVFKLCLRIIKKQLPEMMIYLFVFLGVSITMSRAAATDFRKETSFQQKKSDMAFIAEEESPLIHGLRTELSKIAEIKDLPDTPEDLQDALYFRDVSYIVRIPKGFTEGFMKGEDVRVEKTSVPASWSAAYIDLSIDKYLNTARLYVKQMEGITQEDLVRYLEKDLAISVPVEISGNSPPRIVNSDASYIFNYSSYALHYILILGMSVLILAFNNPDLKKRNACAPLSTGKANIQFILANLAFTFVTWFILTLFSFILIYKNSISLSMVYFVINSLAFAICAASVSFLIGSLVKTRSAISALSNVITLGSSFISGVFVPQELLGSTVLKIASFTPTYWFVKANNTIAMLTQYDYAHVKGILSYILIEMGFALAFFAIALVIGKKKRFL